MRHPEPRPEPERAEGGGTTPAVTPTSPAEAGLRSGAPPDPGESRYGAAAWFEHTAQSSKRVAMLEIVVGLLVLAPFIAIREIPFLASRVHEIRILRFGFEGPPRYVALMQVEAQRSLIDMPLDVGHVIPTGRAGEPGPGGHAHSNDRHGKITRPDATAGERGQTLVERAQSGSAAPLMQSSDLVIETLVRPVYPEDARARGIEGHVAVIAHIDTLGAVAEAEVMTPSGCDELDESSRSAVLRCRFRPYHQDGHAQDVYAVFRFAFRIY